MIEIIRKEFIQILDENEWLDEESKNMAIDKVMFSAHRNIITIMRF